MWNLSSLSERPACKTCSDGFCRTQAAENLFYIPNLRKLGWFVFKNNVPLRKIGRDLHISPSTVQNFSLSWTPVISDPSDGAASRTVIHQQLMEPHGPGITVQKRSLMLTSSTSLGSEASGMDHHTVETCVVIRPISVPDLCWKKWSRRSIQTAVSNQSLQPGSVVVWGHYPHHPVDLLHCGCQTLL